MIAVDAVHWWGPLGWLYRNTAGNIAASAIWGPVGLIVGALWEKRKVIGPIHDKLDLHQRSLNDLHSKHDELHSKLDRFHMLFQRSPETPGPAEP